MYKQIFYDNAFITEFYMYIRLNMYREIYGQPHRSISNRFLDITRIIENGKSNLSTRG